MVNDGTVKVKGTLDNIHESFNSLSNSINNFSIMTNDISSGFSIINIFKSIVSLFKSKNKKRDRFTNNDDDDYEDY